MVVDVGCPLLHSVTSKKIVLIIYFVLALSLGRYRALLLCWWEIRNLMMLCPNSPRALHDAWMGVALFRFQRTMWIYLFFDVTWTIWNVRNKKVQWTCIDWDHLKIPIKLRLGLLDMGMVLWFPILRSTELVAVNLQLVRTWKRCSLEMTLVLVLMMHLLNHRWGWWNSLCCWVLSLSVLVLMFLKGSFTFELCYM